MEALIAAILHDTIEDTPLTREALAAEFGEAVAELVDGVTKLDKLKFRDRRKRPPRASARCCWQCHATCA